MNNVNHRGSFQLLICTVVLLVSFLMVPGLASGHSDFYRIATFDKVRVRVKTGFHYEEVNKAFIIGHLADSLAKSLGYTDSIFLDFNHHYIRYCSPAYFLSFGSGATDSINNESYGTLHSDALVIRIVSHQFSAESTLTLLKFGIDKIHLIKSSQKRIAYNKNYCNWQISSIDTNEIAFQLRQPPGGAVNAVMKQRIEPGDPKYRNGPAYYWKENQFCLTVRGTNEETRLQCLESIYQTETSGRSAIFFDTDSSFYYVDPVRKPAISNRHVIGNVFGNYRPFMVRWLPDNKVSIRFYYYTKDDGPQPRKQSLIYFPDKDELRSERDISD